MAVYLQSRRRLQHDFYFRRATSLAATAALPASRFSLSRFRRGARRHKDCLFVGGLRILLDGLRRAWPAVDEGVDAAIEPREQRQLPVVSSKY